MPRSHVVVVGGGISGLTVAHQLGAKSGRGSGDLKVTVLEKSERVGGKLRSHDVGGLVLDAGAESVLARRPEAVELMAAAGLTDDIVSPAQSGAAVWVAGQLHALPPTQLLGIPYDLDDMADSGILDERGLRWMADEEQRPFEQFEDDVSVGSLVRDRLGQQVLDRLVEPLLGGVYAGNADEISLEMALPGLLEVLNRNGSLMASVRELRSRATGTGSVFASLRGGLGRLPNAVAAASDAEIRVRTTVNGLRAVDGGWELATSSGGESTWLPASAVVLACDGPSAGAIVDDIAPAAAAALSGITYASVALVTFVFDTRDVPALPAGTGFLVPPSQHRLVKAATFVSQKWSWVTDQYPGRIVVRASVGRHGDSSALALSDDALTKVVLAELSQMIGVAGSPQATDVTRWEGSLPQYRVGHRGLVAEIRTALAAQPGLEVCGAAVDGVGIPSCIASARAAATRVSELLCGRGE